MINDVNTPAEHTAEFVADLTIKNYACTIVNSLQLHKLQANASIIYKLEILFTIDQIQDDDISILIYNLKLLYFLKK